MATAAETLQATLSETEYGALVVLAGSTTPLSGRKVASALGVSPTTANDALGTLAEAGFARSEKSGRATLWRLVVSHPSISDLVGGSHATGPTSASDQAPIRLGRRCAAGALVCGMPSCGHARGRSVSELGDSVSVDSIRLQASDVSEVDDILVEGRDAQGEVHRASIAVRRSPPLRTAILPRFPCSATS